MAVGIDFNFILIVVVILLRLNNTGMVSRREALLAADEEGNSEITKERAADLRVYVNRHMNTSTGRFFLKGQYARDSEAVKIKAEEMASGNPHGNIYKKLVRFVIRYFVIDQ